MKLSPKIFAVFSALAVFFAAALVWFLILTQIFSFFSGFVFLGIFSFLVFWKGLLISRQAGELFRLKTKKQIFAASAAAALGFLELIWVISFLPFPFYVLGGLLAVIFSAAFDIFKEYFKMRPGVYGDLNMDRERFKKALVKDIVGSAIFAVIFIALSSWLPRR